MNDEKIVNLLSMAQRAGKCASGRTQAQKALESKKAVLMLIATDASADSKAEFYKLAEKYEIKKFEVLNRERLGSALGKEQRSVAVLLDRGFGKAMETRIMEK